MFRVLTLEKLKHKNQIVMKRFILSLLAGLFVSFAAFAQNYTITITGQVMIVQQNTITPVANQAVIITIDSVGSGFSYENTVYTGELGYYEDVVAIPGFNGYAFVQTMTYDSCLGYNQYNYQVIAPGTTVTPMDFYLCNYVYPECQASFYFYQADPTNPYGFMFENYSTGSFTECFWDFGDSTYSYETNPDHTFPGEGTYNVCLTISDGADCNSTYCALVVVGGGNTGCENYFYYYLNDAYTVTFEGYLYNGGEAYSYIWDFGDGTYGDGQTTTHIYTPQGMAVYMVGLTTIIMDPNMNDSCFYTSYQEVWLQNYPGCNAYFTYYSDYTNPATVNFQDMSYGPNGQSPDAWYWEFGDGTVSDTQNPVHTYADTGFYTVCLTIYTNDSCSSTYCEEIYTGIIPPPSGCESFILPLNMYGLTVDFEGYTVSQYPTDYTWEFGDGVTATGQYVSHTYPAAGMYNVTLQTVDATGCYFQTFTQIWLDSTNTGGCNTMFTYEQTDTTSFTFYGYIYYNNGMIYPDSTAVYSWDFGDGTAGTGQTITHYFQENPAGGYNVCLTTTSVTPDGSACTATYCENISLVIPYFNVFGYVYLENNTVADAAVVHLMSMDSTWQGVVEVQSVGIDNNGFYNFENLPLYNSRMYFIQAELTDGSAYFGQYLPTYHINALNWESANPILPLNNWTADVFMIAGSPVEGGSGSITGVVSNLGARSSMIGVEVVLMDSENNPLIYSRSDEQGNFTFDNLALGTYVIHAEIMGIHTIQAEVTLSEQDPAASVEVQVSGGEANVVFGIPEQHIALENISEIYPNPVNDNSRIDISVKTASKIEVSIISITGQEVKTNGLALDKGTYSYQLETVSLPEGMYMVRIISEQGDMMTKKFMKTR
jgi:PKD repeat protein